MSKQDLEQEYSSKAKKRALHREAHQRRIASQRQYIEAEPIAEPAQLSDQVAQLAAAWGLKRKGGR